MQEERVKLLTEYVREHQQDFYRLAFGYVREREEALDIVQNAICKALTKLSALHHTEYLKTWFYRILVNECLTSLRKNKTVLLFSDPEDRAGGEDFEGKLVLYDAVNRLPPKFKSVIILRFYEDMKIREIADVLKKKESTVKSWLYQALDELKGIIDE